MIQFLERVTRLVARTRAREGRREHNFPAGPKSVEFCAGVDARASTPALWKHGVRLGASRRYDQRHGGLARAAAGIVSLTLSPDRPGFVSGNDGEPPHRVRTIRFCRSRFRKGTNAADGFGVSILEDCRSGVAGGTASLGGGGH